MEACMVVRALRRSPCCPQRTARRCGLATWTERPERAVQPRLDARKVRVWRREIYLDDRRDETRLARGLGAHGKEMPTSDLVLRETRHTFTPSPVKLVGHRGYIGA